MGYNIGDTQSVGYYTETCVQRCAVHIQAQSRSLVPVNVCLRTSPLGQK